MKEQKLEDIKRLVAPILARYGIDRAGFFGSRARGEALPASDLDLVIQPPGQATLLDLVGLKQELEEVLAMKVDVVTYDSLYHRLREAILGEEVPVA